MIFTVPPDLGVTADAAVGADVAATGADVVGAGAEVAGAGADGAGAGADVGAGTLVGSTVGAAHAAASNAMPSIAITRIFFTFSS